MNKCKVAGVLLFLLLAGNLLADPVTVTFNGVLPPATVVGNVYVNPYSATVTDHGTSTTLTVLCDDFDSTIGNGWSWQANVLDASDPEGARFTSIDPNVYRWLTYLATQLLIAYDTHNTTQQGVLSYAMWSVTDTPFNGDKWYDYKPAPPEFINAVNDAVSNAKLSTNPNYSSNWKILTPVTDRGQEFLFRVPEASGVVHLELAMFAVGALLWGLRQKGRRHSHS